MHRISRELLKQERKLLMQSSSIRSRGGRHRKVNASQTAKGRIALVTVAAGTVSSAGIGGATAAQINAKRRQASRRRLHFRFWPTLGFFPQRHRHRQRKRHPNSGNHGRHGSGFRPSFRLRQLDPYSARRWNHFTVRPHGIIGCFHRAARACWSKDRGHGQPRLLHWYTLALRSTPRRWRPRRPSCMAGRTWHPRLSTRPAPGISGLSETN